VGNFIYPPSWHNLKQVPSARSELIDYVNDVANWNNDASNIKCGGADDLVDFLYNVYNMDEGCLHLIGETIFNDEVSHLEYFIRLFDDFIEEWQRAYGNLNSLHEAVLPEGTIEAARALHEKLKERGLPEWTEDSD
jgi:hypothetical protein